MAHTENFLHDNYLHPFYITKRKNFRGYRVEEDFVVIRYAVMEFAFWFTGKGLTFTVLWVQN